MISDKTKFSNRHLDNMKMSLETMTQEKQSETIIIEQEKWSIEKAQNLNSKYIRSLESYMNIKKL